MRRIEKKDLDKIVLSEDFIVKIKDIKNYFMKNQRARKVIAYTGNKEYLNSLSKLKFKSTYDNLYRYLKFLFLTTEGNEAFIFGHEMNKKFSS